MGPRRSAAAAPHPQPETLPTQLLPAEEPAGGEPWALPGCLPALWPLCCPRVMRLPHTYHASGAQWAQPCPCPPAAQHPWLGHGCQKATRFRPDFLPSSGFSEKLVVPSGLEDFSHFTLRSKAVLTWVWLACSPQGFQTHVNKHEPALERDVWAEDGAAHSSGHSTSAACRPQEFTRWSPGRLPASLLILWRKLGLGQESQGSF